jgi:hypothetical protein
LDYIPKSGNTGAAAAVLPARGARFRAHDIRIDRLIALLAATAIAGCTPAQSPPSSAVAPAAVSWDGTYRGTVQITGLGSGTQRQWCETDPQIVFQVSNNAFSYSQPHPNAPDNPTPVYAATIASDGTFRSALANGTMIGHITGTHMSGEIDGAVCVYSFALDRA